MTTPAGDPRARREPLDSPDETPEQLAAALRASEQRRLLAVEAAAIGDWRFDFAAGMLELSPRARRMHGPGTPAAIPLDEHDRLIHPEDRAAVQAARERALDPACGEYRIEFRFLFEDGGVRWFESLGRAVFEERGDQRRPTDVLGVMIDITERKEAEEKLREAERRKDEFLATLAHELRNPLAPIRNGLQILALSTSADERLRRTGEMMERQMNHLVRLVDELLQASRISRGKVELRQKSVLLQDALAGAAEATRVQIEAKGLLVSSDFAEPIAVQGDPDRLVQVFSNLLSNAAKYTQPGGWIRIAARREGGDALISVKDTGCGIPAESLESIFEMFSQDHSQASGGLGVGLSLVRQLVELHGGSVKAESPGIGHGSTFVVRLPLAGGGMEPEARPDEQENVPDAVPARRARRILLVDDNADAADSLAMVLEALGHEVHTVYSGSAALQAFADFAPEVVLLDIGMPEMDGYEVARRIRTLPGGRGVRLLALTGWGQEEDKRRALEAGFDEHLTKPVEPALLESLLARQRALAC